MKKSELTILRDQVREHIIDNGLYTKLLIDSGYASRCFTEDEKAEKLFKNVEIVDQLGDDFIIIT